MAYFDNSTERLFKKMLQASLGFYLVLAVSVTLIHLPNALQQDVRNLPERVARLMLETSQPIPTPVQESAERVGPKPSKEPAKETTKEKPATSRPSPQQLREVIKKTGLIAALIQEEKSGGLDSVIRNQRMKQVLSDTRLITAETSEPSRQAFKEFRPAAQGLSDQKLKDMANAARGDGVQLAKKEGTSLPGISRHGGTQTGADLVQSRGQGGAVRVRGGASGSIDYDAIARVVEQYKGGLIYLYNKELRKVPTLKGTVTVEFSIDSTGKVVEAHVVSSTMEYSPLEEALTSRILYWKFPKLHDSLIVVTYPFVFFPV